MISGKLFNDWGVWLSFSSGSKIDANYGQNLIRVHTLRTWEDFAYLLNQSILADLTKYFPDPLSAKYFKYQINGSLKKIDAINFFKGDIQPRWEYATNKQYGYFNFPIYKDTPNPNLYFHAILMAVFGNSLKMSERINGIRFVDTFTKSNQRFRIQIWTNYHTPKELNVGTLKEDTNQIASFMKLHDIDLSTSLKFFDIDDKKEKTSKEEKDKTKN